MTSVSIPSSTAPLRGVYSQQEIGSSSNGPEESEYDLGSGRPMKRCLGYGAATATAAAAAAVAGSGDSCKKRRKQSTPIRIAATDQDQDQDHDQCDPVPLALSLSLPLPLVPAPFEDCARCPVCYLRCESTDQLQNHLVREHGCKSEPPDVGADANHEAAAEKPPTNQTEEGDVPWLSAAAAAAAAAAAELHPNTGKDWLNAGLAFSPFVGMSPFAHQQDAMPIKPVRIFNPDAYCDLCNKEFCNKYFLKTHKANKHGIYSDAPSAGEAPTFTKNEPRTPPTMVPFGSSPFEEAQPLPPPTIQEEEPPQEPTESPPLDSAATTGVKTEPPDYYESAKLSPQSNGTPGSEASARLRRIGVMNPKAFCEICCKEYCNKYFLRTHKMKRHGIYIPEESRDGGAPAPWPTGNNVQTSPLNLIVTEQAGAGQDRKSTASPSDISCDTCGIRFQNGALAQLHAFSVHGQPGHAEHRPDAISEDLQKLQTMILQLNELDVGKAASCACAACGKEFDNRFFLHAHAVAEHGALLEDVTADNAVGEADGAPQPSNGNNEQGPGEKEPSNEREQQQNNQSTEGSPPTPTPTAERRVSTGAAPTSSYCEICNKELCNKYFMKTHMQRMHGIEIENGAQIGGVVCDICNKELCSKYFLRVHKHNTHGIVEYGASLLAGRKSEGAGGASEPPEQNDHVGPPQPPVQSQLQSQPQLAQQQPQLQPGAPPLKPADLADLSHRYFTHFTEVCPICGRRFRSSKWLRAHLVGDHGQAGADKWAEVEQRSASASPGLRIPNGRGAGAGVGALAGLLGDDGAGKAYHCSLCPFATPLLPLLFVHERSHAARRTPEEEAQVQPQPQPQPQARGKAGSRRRAPASAPAPSLSPAVGVGVGDVAQSLREAAKRAQLPATYALPAAGDEPTVAPAFVMQPFLLEESAGERRVAPSVVFLPVLRKQPAPLTVTFTLTPA